MKKVAVVGLGGMGSAVAYHLSQRGASVLGLESRGKGHDRGSSHGESRLIRKAYFEHPDYVPLLQRSEELWNALQKEAATELFDPRGVVIFGEKDNPVIQGVQLASKKYSVPVEEIVGGSEHFQPLGYAGGGLFEPGAGALSVEACVLAHLSGTQGDLRFDTKVMSYSTSGSGVQLETESGKLEADVLVLCPGAWAGEMAELPISLSVHRNHMYWFECEELSIPCFAYALPEGFFYGFPPKNGMMKIALHAPGERLDRADGVQYSDGGHDFPLVEEFIGKYLPFLGSLVKSKSCYYTMSPDEHFVVDRISENVFIACGFSGHGFKFCPVIGEAIAEWILEGKPRQPIEFLSLRRFYH